MVSFAAAGIAFVVSHFEWRHAESGSESRLRLPKSRQLAGLFRISMSLKSDLTEVAKSVSKS